MKIKTRPFILKKYILTIIWFLGMSVVSTHAAETSFSWLPNSEQGILGYTIYYGQEPGNYSETASFENPQVNGNRVYAILTELLPDTQYYAVIKAYSESLESPFSDEISWTTPPETDSPPPTPTILNVREIE